MAESGSLEVERWRVGKLGVERWKIGKMEGGKNGKL